jgi:hypothetical protein
MAVRPIHHRGDGEAAGEWGGLSRHWGNLDQRGEGWVVYQDWDRTEAYASLLRALVR